MGAGALRRITDDDRAALEGRQGDGRSATSVEVEGVVGVVAERDAAQGQGAVTRIDDGDLEGKLRLATDHHGAEVVVSG